MLVAQFSETDCRYAFVLVTAQMKTEAGWLAAGALQSCVGSTVVHCKCKPVYRQPHTRDCKPCTKVILTLTN
jgi:hypothetical protein